MAYHTTIVAKAEDREDDSMTWVLSLLICLLLYFIALVVGQWIWTQWNSIESTSVKTPRSVSLSTATPEVIQQIKEIEIKKREREVVLQLEKEATQLKKALLKAKNQKRSVTKNTPKPIQKNSRVKKDVSSRSQAENFKIPLGDLLARSQALTQRSSSNVAQAPTASKAFNLGTVAVDQKTEVSSRVLVADRLSGSTYDGGLVSHAKGPEGLIFKPQVDEVHTSEGLPLELIQMVVEENQIQLRYCYEIQLLKTPDLQGDIASEWVISAEGAISQIQLSSNVFDGEDFFSCLQKKMKAWKFPRPKGGVNVSVKYPMRFLKKEVM